MLTKFQGSWRLPMGLCCVSLVLTLLYVVSDSALGQIPPTYGYGYGNEPTVQFSASSYSVMEGDTATITVTLSSTSTQDVSVSYWTSDGTGQAGIDYWGTSGMLYFPAGTTSQSFTVSTMTDSGNTSDVTANLNLSSPSNATLGSPSEATLYIVNPSACQ